MTKGPRIILATPTFNGTFPPFTSSLLATIDALRDCGMRVEWRWRWGQITWYARYELLSEAFAFAPIGEPADAIVFLDGDQSWDEGDVLAVLKPVLSGHADLVGAANAKRLCDWHLVAKAVEAGARGPEELAAAASRDNTALDIPAEDLRERVIRRGFQTATAKYADAHVVSFGLAAIGHRGYMRALRKCELAQELLAPIVRRFDPVWGEDAALAARIKSAGGRVVAFLGSRIRHWSSAGVSHVAALDTQLEREGFRFDLLRINLADAPAGAATP